MSVAETPVARREALRDDRLARYERMIEIRQVEIAIRELHAAGRAWGTTHCADGQEAVAVGIAAAARRSDVIAAGHRTHGLGLALGVTPEALLAEILGRVDGAVGGIGGSIHLTDMSVGLYHTFTIIGTQIPQAAGIALANQVLGRDDVAIALFGDGAANIGAFHEGLNLAAVWRLPVVFVCENNQYGMSMSVDRSTAGGSVVARAAAYGMPGERVDGNDVIDVHQKTAQAIERARAGQGPTLIEAVTYRYRGHSKSDRNLYRTPDEIEEWRTSRDPLDRYEGLLMERGILDAAAIEECRDTAREEIRKAVGAAMQAPLADPSDLEGAAYA